MAKKWDCDTTSSDKLLLLFATLLFNKRAFSLGELSSSTCLNASKATTLRLLRQLERSKIGILVREKRGRESYFRLEHRNGPELSINDDGISHLALCRDLVFQLLPENLQTQTGLILARLGARAENSQAIGAASLVKCRIDYTPYQALLEELEQAIRKNIICRITYLAVGKEQAREHLFAPLRLLASLDSLYIEGWLLEDNDVRKLKYRDPLRLALQRFQSCEPTEFSSENLPRLPNVNNDLLGMMEGEQFEARIWFAPSAARYIAERIWSRDQKLEWREDGSLILTVWMANYHEAISWVLGFGKQAMAIAPDWFVKDLRKELRDASRNYLKMKRDEKKEVFENGEVV